jgi:hypothetical protein
MGNPELRPALTEIKSFAMSPRLRVKRGSEMSHRNSLTKGLMRHVLWAVCSLLVLSGCRDYKGEAEKLQLKVAELERRSAAFADTIRVLRETDQNYYNVAVDLMNSGKLTDAIAKLQELKDKFPASSLLPQVDKTMRDAKKEIEALAKKEAADLDALLEGARKADVEEAIAKIEAYVAQPHDPTLISRAKGALDEYRKRFEEVRAEREAERLTGLRIVGVSSQWAWGGLMGDQLLRPEVKVKIENISSEDVTKAEVKITFIDVSNNEVFSEASDYTIGYGDSPLRPGYSKTAFLYSGVGYKSDLVALNFPRLVAEVSINDHLYRKVTVSRTYGGVNW